MAESKSAAFTDFGFIIRNEVFGNTPDDLRNSVLPLLIPFRHLDLAAGQADHHGSFGPAGYGDRQILDEGMEAVGHAATYGEGFSAKFETSRRRDLSH
jgi:hypothetical protein